MKYHLCSICGNQTPLNSILNIDQVAHCEKCLSEKFPDERDLNGKLITREFDQTVCANCSTDFGERILNKIGEYPTCTACERLVEERIFPVWVKAFFAGIIVLVILSGILNWRFVRGYYLDKKTKTVMASMDAEKIATHFSELSANVPEVPEFQTVALLNAGIELMANDRSDEAYKLFQQCTSLPENYYVDIYMQEAKIGAAFENKDYRQFLIEAKRFLVYDSSATSLAQVASAYSCLFASEKSDSTFLLANDYINRAESKDPEQTLTSYLNMIRYRLTTGNIVTRAQFEAKFPNGYPQ